MIGSNSRGLLESCSGSTSTEEPSSEYRAGGSPLVQQRTGDDDGYGLKIKVSHGSNIYDVSVPSNSTFGDLKRLIGQKTGIEPQMQKLLFRGKEKDDCDPLQMAGVKDNSKVLLMEVTRQKDSVEMEKPSQISVGGEAVAEVRAEVDKLSKQVCALQAVVTGGTKVEDKQIAYLTEMLMRQLLKLDSVEAEGEGKIQRKQEVRRIQSLVDTIDTLKARNSNPFIDCSNTVSLTTRWETFDSGAANVSAPTPVPLSTKVTQEWEQFD